MRNNHSDNDEPALDEEDVKEERKAGEQYNLEEDSDGEGVGKLVRGQLSNQGNFKTMNQKDSEIDIQKNILVPLTVRRAGTLDPYELSY